LIDVNLHTKIQNLEIDCKVLNYTAIASGYVGRDPQGGTCGGNF